MQNGKYKNYWVDGGQSNLDSFQLNNTGSALV